MPRKEPASVEVLPHALSREVGEEATLTARVLEADGNEVVAQILFFAEYFSGLWAVQLQPRQELVP